MARSVIICGECTNAALNSGGVYCTAFHEQIFDETIAGTCGLFTQEAREPLGALPDRPEPTRTATGVITFPTPRGKRPVTDVVVPELEGEQVLVGRLTVPFFGKPNQGQQLAREVEDRLRLHFPNSVVSWTD